MAGHQLINTGLGPALITKTILTHDSNSLGEFSQTSVNMLRNKLSIRPAAATFRRTILATEYDHFLLSIEPVNRTKNAEFADLVTQRLGWRSTTNPFTAGKTKRRSGSRIRDLH
jgi:hypothetical protein